MLSVRDLGQPLGRRPKISHHGFSRNAFEIGRRASKFARFLYCFFIMQAIITRQPDTFTLAYLPDQHLLIGRWLRPVSVGELQAHYQEVLTAALAHENCRHWLLDVRRRRINDADAVRWFGEEFGPQLPQVLGQPVVVAYFAMVGQDVATSDPALWENIRQGSLQGASYCYFDQESTAITWLTQQP